MNLFGYEERSAIFSECRKYRYVLFRTWDQSKPSIIFIGLNPSTANEQKNDPTITRVINLAASWGYGGIRMMNLFAFISSKPEDLETCGDPLGENDKYLIEAAALGLDVIFAWGAFNVKERAKQVSEMFPSAKALIINEDGSPRHPLYVPGGVVPVWYKNNC